MLYAQTIIFDFNDPKSSGEWRIVNDDVMGGVSSSEVFLNSDGTLTFRGKLSPDNYGGFASIRSFIQTEEGEHFEGVIIKIKGDGNIYSLRFRTSNSFDGYAYQAKIQTAKDEWQEFKIPFTDFEATFRGRLLRDKPELLSKNIAQMGILIADKQFGNFETKIDWIKFY
jgi:monofunctional biosynthetic peptidoglycan transglycosylase